MKFLLLLVLIQQAHAEVRNGTKPAARADEVIVINLSDIKVLERAAEILKEEKAWNRKDTRECPASAQSFSLYCALNKASKEVLGEFDHRLGAMEELRRTIEQVASGKKYEHRLMGFNNDPETTFRDIQKVLKETSDKLKLRLKQQQK